MGQEIENGIRLEAVKDYQINGDLVKHLPKKKKKKKKKERLFIHALPACTSGGRGYG